MTIEEKYNIEYKNGRRVYRDTLDKYQNFDSMSPVMFKYGDIVIYDYSWTKLYIKVVTEFNKRFPKTEQELLRIVFDFSKQPAFSTKKESNFYPFNNIYINYNNGIYKKLLFMLRIYDIDISKCELVVRRGYYAEPEECRKYYRNKTIKCFTQYLLISGKSIEEIKQTIDFIDIANHSLVNIPGKYKDFFLFDDDYVLHSYISQVINRIKKRNRDTVRNENIERSLHELELYFKNIDVNEKFKYSSEHSKIIDIIDSKIYSLLSNQGLSGIAVSEIYDSLSENHSLLSSEVNINSYKDLYYFAKISLSRKFNFDYPYISLIGSKITSSDQLIIEFINSKDKFSVKDLFDFADKHNINKPDNILKLIDSISEDYVQVDKDKFVRKSLIPLEKEDFDYIGRFINNLLGNIEFINVMEFKNYEFLPKIEYEWNGYLLAGIVRSYLKDIFIIENSEKHYHTTTYIIKKSNL